MFAEALEIYRTLARESPGMFTSDMSMILGNIGMLYSTMGRFSESESHYREGLKMYRALARDNPEYIPSLATILHNCGILYENMGRLSEAEKIYEEMLEIRRNLFKKKSRGLQPRFCQHVE